MTDLRIHFRKSILFCSIKESEHLITGGHDFLSLFLNKCQICPTGTHGCITDPFTINFISLSFNAGLQEIALIDKSLSGVNMICFGNYGIVEGWSNRTDMYYCIISQGPALMKADLSRGQLSLSCPIYSE